MVMSWIEGWPPVEIDEIDALGGEVPPHDVQVVAV